MSRRPTQDVFNGPVKLGPGFKEFANAVARKLDAEHAQREAKEREEAAQHNYEGSGVYYLIVTKLARGGVRVQNIEPFPFCGHLRADGRNLDVAITNLRMQYAQSLYDQKLLPDWDDARRYAIEHTEFRYDLTGGA